MLLGSTPWNFVTAYVVHKILARLETAVRPKLPRSSAINLGAGGFWGSVQVNRD